ncbi:MAG: pentapeptide repeat-containing protein [Pseudomonadota bacterium]
MDPLYTRLVCFAAACLVACSDGNDSFTETVEDVPPSPAIETLDAFGFPVVRSHVTEAELSAGDIHQTALVVLQPDGNSGHAGDTGEAGFDDVGFSVANTATYGFCVTDTADAAHRLDLLDATGTELLSVANGSCETIELASGDYLKRIYHGPDQRGLTFVRTASDAPVVGSAAPTQARSVYTPTEATSVIAAQASSDDIVYRRMFPRPAAAITTFNVNAKGCPGCYLNGIELRDVDLSGFNFERAHFDNGVLENVDFTGALLRQTSFASATLNNIKFEKADLRGASMNGAHLCLDAGDDCSIEWLDVDSGTFNAPPLPLIGTGDLTHASTYEYQGTRRGWGYLEIVTQDAAGRLYEKFWDNKNSRGWYRGWRPLPALPNQVSPVSQPTLASAGRTGHFGLTMLAQTGDNAAEVFSNWRTIGSGWNAWATQGRPEGQRLISATTATGTRYASDDPTLYLAVLAVEEDAPDADPIIWYKRSVWDSTQGRWRATPIQNSQGEFLPFGDRYPAWRDDECIAPESATASFPADSRPWCPLRAPEGQRFASAPVLARVGFKEAKLTVMMESGELWEFGFDRVVQRLRGWRRLDTPGSILEPVTIESAIAASNTGFSRTDARFAVSYIGTRLRRIQRLDGSTLEVRERLIFLGKRDRFDDQYSWQTRVTGAYEGLNGIAMSDFGFENRPYTITTGALAGGDADGSLFGFNVDKGDIWENLGFPGAAAEPVEGVDTDQAVIHGLVSNAHISEITGEGLSISHADLRQAQFQGAAFEDVGIINSQLDGVNLSGLDLSLVDLSGSSVTDADLSGASFVANINSEDFPCDTALEGGQTFASCLRGVDLSGADLTAARLEGQDLTQTTLDSDPRVNLFPENPPLTTPLDCSGSGATQVPVITRTSFAGSLLSAPQLPPRYWRSLDLSGARIRDIGLGDPTSMVDYSFASMAGLTLAPADADSPMDFSQSQFQGADLSGANFSGGVDASGSLLDSSCFRSATLDSANLRDSSAQDAQFLHASMSNALFDRSDLAGAQFSGSALDQTSFGGADLRSINAGQVGTSGNDDFLSPATLSGSNLNSAILVNADLRGVRFNGSEQVPAATLASALLANADLREADFTGATLDRAALYTDPRFGDGELQMENANFTAASFREAYLEGVDFANTTLSAVDFSEAFLINASLKDASLQRANDESLGARAASLVRTRLEGTDLSGANLQDVDLTSAQLCIEQLTPDEPDNPGEPVSNCALLPIDYSFQSLSDDLRERVLRQETLSPTGASLLEGARFEGATCPSASRAVMDACEQEDLIPREPPRTCPEPDPTSWNPQPC